MKKSLYDFVCVVTILWGLFGVTGIILYTLYYVDHISRAAETITHFDIIFRLVGGGIVATVYGGIFWILTAYFFEKGVNERLRGY